MNHRIVSQAMMIATGIPPHGHREVLGLMVGDSESKPFCAELLRRLRACGLDHVQLVICDSHSGLVAATIRMIFAQAVRNQRDVVVDMLARQFSPRSRPYCWRQPETSQRSRTSHPRTGRRSGRRIHWSA